MLGLGRKFDTYHFNGKCLPFDYCGEDDTFVPFPKNTFVDDFCVVMLKSRQPQLAVFLIFV